MLDGFLTRLPLSAYLPLRRVIHALPRRHPARMAATRVLQQAARAHRNRLASRLAEIRPLDRPDLSFEPVDSMVMDAVFWFGVRGYEGTVSRVWTTLCARSEAVLEIGGNVGLFTVLGATATRGSYTVVEPVPANAATLRANLARNGAVQARVLEAAAVAGQGTRSVTLNVPDEGRDRPVGAHLLDEVEVSGRGDTTRITVPGMPMRELAQGCDLIKIDAEGIEAALLGDIHDQLVSDRPSLLIEVLPEATKLGALLASLAEEAGYTIFVLPEYGSDTLVRVPAAAFHAGVPKLHASKDVVLTTHKLA